MAALGLGLGFGEQFSSRRRSWGVFKPHAAHADFKTPFDDGDTLGTLVVRALNPKSCLPKSSMSPAGDALPLRVAPWCSNPAVKDR